MTGFSPQYLGYMRSQEWRNRRQRALARAGYRCQVCGGKSGLQVHHVSYANLGHEQDEDLTVLCSDCHVVVTWWLRFRRWWRWFWK
jgi:5-methylcytosine-specific restriction endonuclease McrA